MAGPDADRADAKRFLAPAANDFDLIAHGPTITRRLLKPRKIKALFILADHSRRFWPVQATSAVHTVATKL